MRSMALSILLATSCVHAEGLARFPSPDRQLEVIVLGVPFQHFEDAESILVARDYETLAPRRATADLTSPSGGHGFDMRGRFWTPDSRFFVATGSSSGGHSAWQARVLVYSRELGDFVNLGDVLGAISNVDDKVQAPDWIRVEQLNDDPAVPGERIWRKVRLSQVLAGYELRTRSPKQASTKPSHSEGVEGSNRAKPAILPARSAERSGSWLREPPEASGKVSTPHGSSAAGKDPFDDF